jgi:hypothetical protein
VHLVGKSFSGCSILVTVDVFVAANGSWLRAVLRPK